MRASARRYGRDPAKIGIEATMTIIDRTPEQLRAEVEAWRQTGATHITVNTMPERWVEAEQRWNKASIEHLADPTAHVEAIRKFRNALPELF